jgi:hypothetical protein
MAGISSESDTLSTHAIMVPQITRNKTVLKLVDGSLQ